MVDDELRLHDRVYFRGISAFCLNRVSEAGEIDERRLAENIMAHDTRGIPRKIKILFAVDQLFQRVGELGRVALAHQILGEQARGVR